MDEIYVTYVDDEHVDNHDYDDNTDDDHDNNNDLYGRACNARVNTSNIPFFVNKYLKITKLRPETPQTIKQNQFLNFFR